MTAVSFVDSIPAAAGLVAAELVAAEPTAAEPAAVPPSAAVPATGGSLLLASRRDLLRRRDETGMSTAEYAVGMIAACGFAALLWTILHSGPVQTALTGLVTKALHQL